MVLGTSGSGKTTAIVILIKISAKMKTKGSPCQFTNSAIDNVITV